MNVIVLCFLTSYCCLAVKPGLTASIVQIVHTNHIGPEEDIDSNSIDMPQTLKNEIYRSNEKSIKYTDIQTLKDALEKISIYNDTKYDIEEMLKKISNNGDVESLKSDLSTCVIRTVTSFIACMHKESPKDFTNQDPILTCFSEAVTVFVKCILSGPISPSITDGYTQNSDLFTT